MTILLRTGQMGMIVSKVAIYARVSTKRWQDPAIQLRELGEYCKRRNLEVFAKYIDVGVSGVNESRKELNRLMQDAKRRRFDCVVVWKLDRWGRSLKHIVTSLAELEALGISFVSLRDNLDLTTPAGRLMFQIVGALAEFERCLIAERVKAGIENAQSKGVRIGRPRVKVDPQQIASLRKSGASWSEITEKTGISKGSAQRAFYSLPKNFPNSFPETR